MRILNKRAKFDYKLFEKFETGIALTGAEVKAIRAGRVDISRSFAKVIKGEIYLVNANLQAGGDKEYNPTRTRKLLLHKNQIVSIQTKIKQKKLTLMPTKLYTKKRLIKVEIALAKAKRKFEKRQTIKKKDIEREIERELKGAK